MNAPIIVFAYNRLEHLKRTLDALAAADGAKESELIIFADGHKGNADKNAVLMTQEYVKKYALENKFRKTDAIIKESNMGLAESVISGVTEVIDQYGSVIVVEDDIVVAKDFLSFMNQALDYYQDNKKVWSISGWAPTLEYKNSSMEDTYAWYRCSSWGWATWKDRWESVDWEVRDYCDFKYSYRKRKQMNRGGADMADMLDMQQAGKINSWAVRWGYAESKQDMLTIYPYDSKAINIGRDGSGTNCHDMGEKDVLVINNEIVDRNNQFCDAEVDVKLKRKLYLLYSGSFLHRNKFRIKSCLRRIKELFILK